MKTTISSVLALALVATGYAKASTMDIFTITDGSSSYAFTLPDSGTPSLGGYCPLNSTEAFCYLATTVTDQNNNSSSDNIEFYTALGGTGVDIVMGNDYSSGLILSLSGYQLFTGTVDAPTFLTGNFALIDGVTEDNVNLNISPESSPVTTPVPEPSSLALIGTGLLAAAGALRRRLTP